MATRETTAQTCAQTTQAPSWSEKRNARQAAEKARREAADRRGSIRRDPGISADVIAAERIRDANLGEAAIVAGFLSAMRSLLRGDLAGLPDKPLQDWTDWEIIDFVRRQAR